MLTEIDFDLKEESFMLERMVKDFAEKKIRPYMMDWDERQYFPQELFKEMGQLGLMGVLVPEEFGGSAMNYHDYIVIISGIARVCGAIGLSLAAHNSLCTGHILQFGNASQKAKWLPRLASGEWIGAWGLTEANTGSDALNMNTTVRLENGEYVINGSKNWITHGSSAQVAVLVARTGERGSAAGISAFVVERGTPGFRAGKKENKLGMRASETTEMIFEDCRIPQENLLGVEGEGFKQAMKVLDGGRISIAALSLGIAEGALEASIQYAKQREQFGHAISSYQGISFKLADMATDIEAANLLTHQAAALKIAGKPMTKQAAMAKYFASEVAVKCATESVQIFGGYGYTKDFPAEKYYRDAKLCTIGEGTSEIQKIVIAREILR